MSTEKRQRAAERALKTRERRIHLKGPARRRGPQEVERERMERGRRTLAGAFGDIPSQADFLRTADFFEYREESDAVDRAFIVPDGLSALLEGTSTTLYWYKRDLGIPLQKGDAVSVSTRDGERYIVVVDQHVASEMTVKLKKKKYVRRCTGSVACTVTKTNNYMA